MKQRSLKMAAILLFFAAGNATAQVKNKSVVNLASPVKPKIVIGLVIDQMRWDYLYKYKDLYTEKGFKRLLSQGYSCENTMITHLPTYTAVGHTGIYTGSYPSIHGIVGNSWFDRATGKTMYCTADSTVKGIGSNTAEGKMSPRNLFANTITDELRLSNNFQSKVIGVCLKDRGSILPAGHSANAAYWYDDTVGKWISSSYYMNELPSWVNDFNNQQYPDKYMSGVWKTLLPIKDYTLSTKDDVPYEGKVEGEQSDTFPHQLSLVKDKYVGFKSTPFGNTYVLDFAKKTLENEKMGKGAVTDFLTVSLSSTDYIGHFFGPNSIETEDTYLRLDKDLSGFMDYLDSVYGKNNYLLFLTADHGVANTVGYLNEHKLPAETFFYKELTKELNDSIVANFNEKNGVLKIENSQIYLNNQVFADGDYKSFVVKNYLVSLLNKKSYVSFAFDLKFINQTVMPDAIKSIVNNSFNVGRSGDIQIIPKPANVEGWNTNTGTTHGLWNPYDAHIPLVWYGWNIQPGKLYREVHMSDIASTLAALLKIQMPNGAMGRVIEEVVR